MESRQFDPLRRAIRSFVQGGVGVFILIAVPALNQIVTSVGSGGVAVIDVPFWRNVGIAVVAGGAMGLVSFTQNALEDNVPKFPALLKGKASSGANPVPDPTGLP